MKALPIVYRNQQRAEMNKEVLAEWLEAAVLLEIKRRMQRDHRK